MIFSKGSAIGNFYNYIPHRHDEGFGLNGPAMHEIAENGAKLVVTLDCGITDVGPVELANDHGVDVIITDHHTPPAELPNSVCYRGSKAKRLPVSRQGSLWRGRRLEAHTGGLEKEKIRPQRWPRKMVSRHGRHCYFVRYGSFDGENRVLAYYGLAVLRKSPRKGLVQLLKKIGVRQKDIIEDDVGFSIAPRINAASRMGVPMDAFSLLTADDEHEAERLAEHLDAINDERKGAVASLVKDVKRKIRERYGDQSRDGSLIPNVLVLGSPNWRPSLLGLAANTCADEFDRPVFLWGRDGDGLYKGSCRAGNVSSIHLVELMTAVPALTFAQFGGHTGAGGFTVSKEIVFDLEKILNTAYENLRSKADQDPLNHEEKDTSLVDGIFKTDDITWRLYDEVNKFAPFGTGNPKPVFILHDAVIAEVKHFGKEKNHLELLLEKQGGRLFGHRFFQEISGFWRRSWCRQTSLCHRHSGKIDIQAKSGVADSNR